MTASIYASTNYHKLAVDSVVRPVTSADFPHRQTKPFASTDAAAIVAQFNLQPHSPFLFKNYPTNASHSAGVIRPPLSSSLSPKICKGGEP